MSKNSKGFSFIIVIFLVAVTGAAYYFYQRDNSEGNASVITNIKEAVKIPSPIPTTFPFQEMTIPYLRSRKFQSSLGDLQKVSENSNYTSYLTSYSSDGLKINGLLTIPRGDPPSPGASEGQGVGWPAVVFLHGYIPPQNYRTLVNYAAYVDYLAKSGLVVFKIDLRGHDKSEGEPGGSYYSGDYIIDTLNAVAALKNADFVDANRIGLWGHSMAGNVVFRALAAMPDIPKVVIWAGAVYTYEDFSQFRISDASYQPPPQTSERRRKRDELFAAYGQFDPQSEFWKQVPATNYLDEIKGEVQIHHAVDDNVVAIDYSRNLMSILDNTDIAHVLYEYPSGGHNLTGSSFSQAVQRTVEFLRR